MMGSIMDAGHEADGDDIETLEIYESYNRLRRALHEIDAIAVQKKAGAAKRMQLVARAALSNGDR